MADRAPGWAIRELEARQPSPEPELGSPSMLALGVLCAVLLPALGMLAALLVWGPR